MPDLTSNLLVVLLILALVLPLPSAILPDDEREADSDFGRHLW